ncbi:MAG TPA: hypothetical protein VFY29_16350 [Terriglobia bacterium]|nr:hypothetical protein [Terriglobia bacterium]
MPTRVIPRVIVFALAVVCAAAAESRDPRKTLDEMITALGGKAFLEVREIHNQGRYYSFYRGQLDGGDVFTDYIRFPDSERTELGPPRYRSVTINNGGYGWGIQGDSKWEQSDTELADFYASFGTSYEYVTRFVLADPDIAFVDLGLETVDFKRANVIEFRDTDKNRLRYYIERDTHLPLKLQVRLANDTLVREEAYSNWHNFDGVFTPMFVARYRDGVKVMEIRLESVRYNAGLPDSLFAP